MKGILKAIIVITLSLAALIPFVSTDPDGLEKVVHSLSIHEPKPLWTGLMPDYTIDTMKNPYVASLISGLIGLLLVFSVAWGIGWVTARKNHAKIA